MAQARLRRRARRPLTFLAVAVLAMAIAALCVAGVWSLATS